MHGTGAEGVGSAEWPEYVELYPTGGSGMDDGACIIATGEAELGVGRALA